LLRAAPDILEVLADDALPLWSHPIAPSQAPEEEEVDPHLSAVAQQGGPGDLLKGELLDRLGDGTG
jgi:hypothetical protein